MSGLRSFSHKFERVHLAPPAGRGRITTTMRSIVGAFRVRGRLRVGGASDEKVIDALNHRCRVVFLSAPSPGARAFHARTPTSPRTRGEVRERLRRAGIFPGQACRTRGQVKEGEASSHAIA